MNGLFIDNTDGVCPHSVWFSGCKIHRSNSMPERTWGAYLPGDEPGWNCAKTGDACPGEMHWKECPRIERTLQICPICLIEGRAVNLRTDPEEPDQPHWCPECGSYWDDRDSLMEEWDTIREMIV